MALTGGFLKPLDTFGCALCNAVPHEIQASQEELRIDMTLFGGFPNPACAFGFIPDDTFTSRGHMT